jgi:hypothetical protein
MNYKKLSNCWLGLKKYNLSGDSQTEEKYNPITMSLPEWQKYRSNGESNLELSGGVAPSGTMGGGAVFRGHVNQGYNMGVGNLNTSDNSIGGLGGLGWL